MSELGRFEDIVAPLWDRADKMKAALDDPAIMAAHDYYMYSNDESALAELAALGYDLVDASAISELRTRLTWRWALAHGQGPQAAVNRQEATGAVYGEA